MHVADDLQELKIFSSGVTDFTGFQMPAKLFELKNLPARQLNQVFRIFLTIGKFSSEIPRVRYAKHNKGCLPFVRTNRLGWQVNSKGFTKINEQTKQDGTGALLICYLISGNCF